MKKDDGVQKVHSIFISTKVMTRLEISQKYETPHCQNELRIPL